QRTGHESEISERAARVELVREMRDAVVERLALSEEMVEILLDRDVDGVADGRRAGVEIDEHGPAVSRESKREVDGEGRLADSALAGRDRNDPFDGHSRWELRLGV